MRRHVSRNRAKRTLIASTAAFAMVLSSFAGTAALQPQEASANTAKVSEQAIASYSFDSEDGILDLHADENNAKITEKDGCGSVLELGKMSSVKAYSVEITNPYAGKKNTADTRGVGK
ncbi:MAG: hypothetical protein ACLRVS_03725 [Lachnospiraceae bacterium]